ncbi:hypothetical protein F0562_027005 [Nyssa sinensis]|uniref:Protein kinase domain-containing protein n=1 Tax=Nyssa sinensis TaxID=561372 RepID=A0A5J5B3U6_9ASTE|nr:hypothetical protein F0562_027005 [Nyssa sinensis]
MTTACNLPTSFASLNAHVPLSFFFLSFLFISFADSLHFQITHSDPQAVDILNEGDAAASIGSVELSSANYYGTIGRATYTHRLQLWDSGTGILSHFTTQFSFIIGTQGSPLNGDGLVFFLAPVDFQIPPNSAGGFLGLFNYRNAFSSKNKIVLVEFDTFPNPDWDPSFQHVGINNNSLASAKTMAWNASLHSGETVDAWITYNATSKNLSVFWSYGLPPNSSLYYQIDLLEALPEWVIIGFSASTGLNVEQHAVASWEFTSSFDTTEENRRDVKRIRLVIGVPVSVGVLIIGMIVVSVIWWKWKQITKGTAETVQLTSINDDLERGAGPRRFAYTDLVSATNNFAEERKLGEGGFGGVYRGYLVDLDIEVAVKKISGGSKQGKKEYTTESPLAWAVRYKIALGLASALLYLREEWELCVVHRDIKPSNIMLDSSFKVKVGDFGLARLVKHELGPQTTRLAGTFGYMAPEYIRTGKASKEKDVYSFGVVALEIACGKMSVGSMEGRSQMELVEWIWDL